MHRTLLCVALVSGCVERVQPDTSSATADEPETTASEPTTTADEPTTTTGPEPATTGEPAETTSAPHAPEGLFMCPETELCPRWDCADGCDEPGPEGMCVFKALQDRAAGSLEIERCVGDCTVYRLIPRGEGTDAARWQWQWQTSPPGYSDVHDCELQSPEFFSGCLAEFTAVCADPAEWVKNCLPTSAVCFD